MRRIKTIIKNNEKYMLGDIYNGKIITNIESYLDSYGFVDILMHEDEELLRFYENDETFIMEFYEDGIVSNCEAGVKTHEQDFEYYNSIKLEDAKYSVGQYVNGLLIDRIVTVIDRWGWITLQCLDKDGGTIVQICSNPCTDTHNLIIKPNYERWYDSLIAK